MAVCAHTYSFGELPLAVHDRVVEALAVGAVLATVAWLASLGEVRPLEAMGVSYTLAPAYAGDLRVQHVRLCAALAGAAVTCLDMAIYAAAVYQARGCEAWVAILRERDDSAAHAVVVFPDQPGIAVDPSASFPLQE